MLTSDHDSTPVLANIPFQTRSTRVVDQAAATYHNMSTFIDMQTKVPIAAYPWIRSGFKGELGDECQVTLLTRQNASTITWSSEAAHDKRITEAIHLDVAGFLEQGDNHRQVPSDDTGRLTLWRELFERAARKLTSGLGESLDELEQYNITVCTSRSEFENEHDPGAVTPAHAVQSNGGSQWVAHRC